MAINDETTLGEEPDVAAGTTTDEMPAAERGGCMNLGWGCLPVLVGGMVALPTGLLW